MVLTITSTLDLRFLNFEGVIFFHTVAGGRTNYPSPSPGIPAQDPLAMAIHGIVGKV